MFSSFIPIPAAVCQTPINCSGCGYASGFSSTPSTTLKITVLAPMPIASVMSVIALNTGARRNLLMICRSRSNRMACTGLLRSCKASSSGLWYANRAEERSTIRLIKFS